MSTTPPRTEETAAEAQRTLQRSDEGRMLTGVCAGLGRYTGMDPVLFRVGFAVLVLASGIGILLYLAAFLLMRGTDGAPGHLEQWTRRVFDAQTVLALLAAVFAFGLIINVASDGISEGAILVGTLLAIALLAAHARGADLLGVAKSLPERLSARRAAAPEAPRGVTGEAGAAFSGTPYEPAAERPAAPRSATVRPAATPPAAAAHATAPPAAAQPAAPARQPDAAPPAAPEERPMPAEQPAPPQAMPQDRPAPPPPPPVPGAPGRPDQEYRRPADPAREARAGHAHYSSGEPFAPYGPYRTGPAYPPGPYPPPPVATAPGRPARAKRPRSFIGVFTFLAALLVGGVMVATQPQSSPVNTPALAAVLVTIGVGLVVAAWLGRGAGLVAAGVGVSLILVLGNTVIGIPNKVGSFTWQPTSTAEIRPEYVVGIGDGTIDLSEIELAPGSHVRVTGSIAMGRLIVIVPPEARAEVHGRVKLGEVQIGHSSQSGPHATHEKVLEPEVAGPGTAPVVEVYLQAGIGDVEVRHAA